MPAFKVRETPQFWRVEIREKSAKKPSQWATMTFGKGILSARFRSGKKWFTQALLFKKKKWSKAESLVWSKEYMKENPNPEGAPANSINLAAAGIGFGIVAVIVGLAVYLRGTIK